MDPLTAYLINPLITRQAFWKDSQHTLWHLLLAGEGSGGVAADGEARGQEIPVCFPLTKMSKAAAEEMSVAGDPSKLRILRSYRRVNGRSTVPAFL